ncbi:Retrovirus-related Pol polyprotein from transposon [Sesamum angolense]|uniref:Retrovirus-related Pol polyprotein from transposon n=1 Tax=Sesamum angolense TaxID=2727404 RepID=A0AAE1XAF8_9LAMI|nr:Retrovirus-related Pol polyprotein from transposon [Sesamum angolense]
MMDASQGYHQVMLAPGDHERVSFITSDGTFYYVAMPFGLKNVGVTYQRLVDKIFRPQLGRNIEVYVDDILVKSKEARNHVEDLEEAFAVIRKYRLKLNPRKCAFGVSGGRFLGFMRPRSSALCCYEKKMVLRYPFTTRSHNQYSPEASPRQTRSIGAISKVGNRTEQIRHLVSTLNDHQDGSSTTQGSGVGIVITSPQGEDMEFAIKFYFKASNNEVKYEALVLGMRMAQDAGALHLLAYSNSKLIVKQVSEEYEAKEYSMDERYTRNPSQTPCSVAYPKKQGLHVLKDIHDGYCGSHIGTWTLANKALQAGYFWPTMKQDARWLVNKYVKCQKHATLIYQPAKPLNIMLSPCSFSQWGMDIVGPFLLATRQRKFLQVSINYFTKWVKMKPLARITKGKVMKFVWKNIICRFALFREIISDNGRQFQG